MREGHWGDFSGAIFYRTLLFRGNSIWTSPFGAPRQEIRPMVEFQVNQLSRWNLQYKACSESGEFGFQVEAIDPPLLGVPNFHGSLKAHSGLIADIRCRNESSQILSIRTKSNDLHVTANKSSPRNKESDIVLAEDSVGDLAKILWDGYEETFTEQAATLLDLGLGKRGEFCQNPLPTSLGLNHPIRICALAALCIYFYQLEPLYNSEGSFG